MSIPTPSTQPPNSKPINLKSGILIISTNEQLTDYLQGVLAGQLVVFRPREQVPSAKPTKSKPISRKSGILIISTNEQLKDYLQVVLAGQLLVFRPPEQLHQATPGIEYITLTIVDMVVFDAVGEFFSSLTAYMKKHPVLVLLNREGRSYETIRHAREKPLRAGSKKQLHDLFLLAPYVAGLLLGPFARCDIEAAQKACTAREKYFTSADPYVDIPAERFRLTECGTRGGYQGVPLSILKYYHEEWAIKSVSVVGVILIDDRTALFLMPNGSITIWDIASWGVKTCLPIDGCEGVAIAADNPNAIVACCSEIFRASAETLRAEVLFNVQEAITHMSLAEDHDLLAVGYDDQSLEVFSLRRGKSVSTIQKRESEETQCMLATNVRMQLFVSVSTPNKPLIRVWDVETGKYQRTLRGHENPVIQMRSSADGRMLVSACKEGEVRFWNLQTGTSTVVYARPSMPLELHVDSEKMQVLCFFSDGTIVEIDVISQMNREHKIFNRDQKVAAFFSGAEKVICCDYAGFVSQVHVEEEKVVTAHLSEF